MGARLVERELDLEDLGVPVRLSALADGGSRVVQSHPAAIGEVGNRAQCVGES